MAHENARAAPAAGASQRGKSGLRRCRRTGGRWHGCGVAATGSNRFLLAKLRPEKCAQQLDGAARDLRFALAQSGHYLAGVRLVGHHQFIYGRHVAHPALVERQGDGFRQVQQGRMLRHEGSALVDVAGDLARFSLHQWPTNYCKIEKCDNLIVSLMNVRCIMATPARMAIFPFLFILLIHRHCDTNCRQAR